RFGPEPGGLFAAPERASLVFTFLSDIGWARESGAAAWEGQQRPELASMAYRVLSAARSWRYLETGDLGSKVEGAMWLKRQEPGPDPPRAPPPGPRVPPREGGAAAG